MNILSDTSLLIALAGLTGLILLIPLPGTNHETSVNIQGEQVPLEMYDQTNFSDNAIGRYTSNGDIKFGKINVATKNHGLLVFLDTCSHEIMHAELDAEQKSFDTHHRIIADKKFFGFITPWNWKTQCLGLLPSRLNFI